MYRILCIEDDAETRILLKKSLESSGLLVDTVWNGEKGIEAAKSGQFHCIVLDLMMSGMDGFQVIANLRATSSTRHLPILVLTAKLDEDSRTRAFEAGADEYVIKPFNINELVATIWRLTKAAPPGAGD